MGQTADIYILGGSQTDFARNWQREGLGLYDMFADSLREAVATLTSLGISPVLAGLGHVLSQEPPAGSPLPSIEEGCRLWLGRR